MIQDAGYMPTYEEIVAYLNEPARVLWQDLDAFIRQKYKVSPRITYSKCSSKPGWNVKYQKSGKSLCTLYPEQDGFVALVVILLEMVPLIEAMSGQLESEVLATVKSARPFNGTLWLMIPVNRKPVVNNVQELLMLKHATKQPAAGDNS